MMDLCHYLKDLNHPREGIQFTFDIMLADIVVRNDPK